MTRQEIAKEIKVAEDHLAELRSRLERAARKGYYILARDADGEITYVSDGPGDRVIVEQGQVRVITAASGTVHARLNVTSFVEDSDGSTWNIEWWNERPGKGRGR